MSDLSVNTRKLAAIAYGEASVADDSNEIGGIAFAVANRARAWSGKSIEELLAADPNYTYAVKDGNARYQRLIAAAEAQIVRDAGMKLALDWAKRALSGEGADPSNGAYWWDGRDFKTNYKNHPKVKDGFKYGSVSHNIFGVPEASRPVTVYWKVRNKKTGAIVNSTVRGRYEFVWKSTAAHGSTIFWTHNSDFLKATGSKEYR